ncbi:MAG: hypothetical protein KGL18_18865 [Burkholderiales bacterium]|nr:hypothetical protein [Burkholderiales bacterium]MDE1927179.1 hypothetical protein [Burkholderiales bacterium]MDE2161011.1 hypothetical protein [Burkholderiales bacterium]MDE2505031.1 hypothetical protein [Burkholderiales bacterium]
MTRSAHPLARHLVLIVTLKLALLTALWLAFFRAARVEVDAEIAAAHLVAPAAAPGVRP